MSTICLAMIVKNEGHCIKKCLESVKSIISYWIICDNGSIDNTEEIVKTILKDIPGEYHHHTWEDFSTNRNKSLNLSKNKADYTLIIDADDYLIFNDQKYFKNLSNFAYQINIQQENIVYPRIQIVKNSIEYQYNGVLHEYIELPKNIISITIPNCTMIYSGLGSRSQNPNKYYNDAQTLEKALEFEPNNSRYAFYCAQSYKDCKQFDKAIEFYLKRINMNGWKEEIYISFLTIAKILQHINSENILDIINAYVRTINYNPNRIEAYYHLSNYCRLNSLFDLAYLYSNLGSKLKKPNNSLFMEIDCYNWKIYDELSLAAYYIGNIDESINLTNNLLNNKFVPKNHLLRIKNNLGLINFINKN